MISNSDSLTETSKKRVSSPSSPTEADETNPFLASMKEDEYQRGFLTIGFITLLNASCNPLWHAAFANGGPSPFLLNAGVSVVALLALLVGGPLLDRRTPTVSNLAATASAALPTEEAADSIPSNGDVVDPTSSPNANVQHVLGGMELGLWKFLGTTAHLYGLSLTTADHGAFLIQLTTLIVPVVQGLQGEKIPRQIQFAVGLALLGVYAFTQDPSGAATTAVAAQQQATGDALCVGAAVFYSFYDIQTFKWGKQVPRKQLVTTKVATQAALSVALCATVASGDTVDFFRANPDWATSGLLVPVILWSGLIVNALATFLQVGGMQAVGPTRAQTIFASQPLWSSMLAYAFLGETVGVQGAVGGCAFLFALFLAATAPQEPKTTQQSTS